MKRFTKQGLKISFSKTSKKRIYLVKELYPEEKLEPEISKRETELIENVENPNLKTMKELIILHLENKNIDEAKNWFEFLLKNDKTQSLELYKFLFKFKEEKLEREEIVYFLKKTNAYSKSTQHSFIMVLYVIGRELIKEFDFILGNECLNKIYTMIEQDKTLLDEHITREIYSIVLDTLTYLNLKNGDKKFVELNEKFIAFKKSLKETNDELYASGLMNKVEYAILKNDYQSAIKDIKEPIRIISSLLNIRKSTFFDILYLKSKLCEVALLENNLFTIQKYEHLSKTALEYALKKYNENINDHNIANIVIIYQMKCTFDLTINDYKNFEENMEKASFYLKQINSKKFQVVFVIKKFELMILYYTQKEDKEGLYNTFEEYAEYLNESTLELNINFVTKTLKNFIQNGIERKKFKKISIVLQDFEPNLKIDLLIFYINELMKGNLYQEAYDVLKNIETDELSIEKKDSIDKLLKEVAEKLNIELPSEGFKCTIL